jgi:hypothetical protein
MLPPADPAVRAFLRHSMIVQVATLSPKMRPFVTPLWFVVHRDILYIAGAFDTWAGKNVDRHPEVALLFSGERAGRPHEVLRLRGIATRHRGFPPWGVLLRFAFKYYLSFVALPVELRHARKWRLRGLYYAQLKGGTGHIQVVPATGELLTRP